LIIVDPVGKTSTPGSNPGGASNSSQDRELFRAAYVLI